MRLQRPSAEEWWSEVRSPACVAMKILEDALVYVHYFTRDERLMNHTRDKLLQARKALRGDSERPSRELPAALGVDGGDRATGGEVSDARGAGLEEMNDGGR